MVLSSTSLLHCQYIQQLKIILVSSQNGQIFVLDRNTYTILQTIQIQSRQAIRSFQYQNNLLYIACYDSNLYIYKYQNDHFIEQQVIEKMHDKEIKSISVLENYIATVSRDRSIKMYQFNNQEYEIYQIIPNAAKSDMKYVKLFKQTQNNQKQKDNQNQNIFLLASTADGHCYLYELREDELINENIIFQAQTDQYNRLTAITHSGILVIDNQPIKISQNGLYSMKQINQKNNEKLYLCSGEDGSLYLVENNKLKLVLQNIVECEVYDFDILDIKYNEDKCFAIETIIITDDGQIIDGTIEFQQ